MPNTTQHGTATAANRLYHREETKSVSRVRVRVSGAADHGATEPVDDATLEVGEAARVTVLHFPFKCDVGIERERERESLVARGSSTKHGTMLE